MCDVVHLEHIRHSAANNFGTKYQRITAERPMIREWQRNVRGLVVSFGRQDPGVQAQLLDIERIRESFVCSPQKFIDTCSRELQIPC